MSTAEFIAALETQPDPPCEVYRCQHYTKCAEQQLACRAYGTYVRDKLVVPPTGLPSRGRFIEIMSDGQSSRPQATAESAAAP